MKAEAERRAAKPREKEATMPQASVVIAQREPEVLDVVRIHLEKAGYGAMPALNGLQAYEALEARTPVAVILDLDLPGMSGFRLVKLIRRNPRWKRVPLIVATSYAFEEVEDIANEGIDDFMGKPFDPAELVSRVELAIARSRQVAA